MTSSRLVRILLMVVTTLMMDTMIMDTMNTIATAVPPAMGLVALAHLRSLEQELSPRPTWPRRWPMPCRERETEGEVPS